MDENLELIVAQMAVEYWRLARLVTRAVELAPEDSRQRLAASARYTAARVNEILDGQKISIVEFDGADFEVNLPASPINGDAFPGEARLIVERTIEPAIICDTRVIITGKVLLAKKS
jgi:hypothetical protein